MGRGNSNAVIYIQTPCPNVLYLDTIQNYLQSV